MHNIDCFVSSKYTKRNSGASIETSGRFMLNGVIPEEIANKEWVLITPEGGSLERENIIAI